MRKFLNSQFPDVVMTFDKTVIGILHCSDKRYRPDVYIDLAGHVVIIECDERQHEGYDDACEVRRLVELLAACEGKPLMVIRWNPDAVSIGGEKQRVIKKQRLEALEKAMEAALRAPPAQLLTVQYMYYDNTREARLQDLLTAATAQYYRAGCHRQNGS